jgi:hypothetical protein
MIPSRLPMSSSPLASSSKQTGTQCGICQQQLATIYCEDCSVDSGALSADYCNECNTDYHWPPKLAVHYRRPWGITSMMTTPSLLPSLMGMPPPLSISSSSPYNTSVATIMAAASPVHQSSLLSQQGGSSVNDLMSMLAFTPAPQSHQSSGPLSSSSKPSHRPGMCQR